MKVELEQLESLWTMQQLIISQRRLVAAAKELTTGENLKPIENHLLEINQALRVQQLNHELLEDDRRKLDSDLELVEKRIAADEQKIGSSSNPKEISGFQHELDGLRRRKSLLEDSELGLLDQIESSSKILAELRSEKAGIEAELEKSRDELTERLAKMKGENARLNQDISSQRANLPEDLVAVFDRKLDRGNAIGRIVRSACTACNMNLNSTAMAELSHIAPDELATCPECTAIVIRE